MFLSCTVSNNVDAKALRSEKDDGVYGRLPVLPSARSFSTVHE